jgi:hypothetical protein
MTSAMTAFGIAVGGGSVACYLLMSRAEKRRARGKSSRDGSGPDAGGYAPSNAESISGWFGGGHSATDSSGNPVDSGGDVSGGRSDGGGGDGGGGAERLRGFRVE